VAVDRRGGRPRRRAKRPAGRDAEGAEQAGEAAVEVAARLDDVRVGKAGQQRARLV